MFLLGDHNEENVCMPMFDGKMHLYMDTNEMFQKAKVGGHRSQAIGFNFQPI